MRSKSSFKAIIFLLSLIFLANQASLANTFPSGHPENAVSATFIRGYGTSIDVFTIYMWRENYAVWIEIEVDGDNQPFICSSSFSIIQNNIQFDTVSLLTFSGDTQCDDVYINSVFEFSQWSFHDNPADLNYDFILLFDGGAQFYTLDMSYVNMPPLADAGPDQIVNKGVIVTLDASNSYDPDGDTVSFQWLQTDGIDVILSDETSVNPTFIAPDVYWDDTLTFQLTIKDGTFRATDTISIKINPVESTTEQTGGDGGDGGDGCFISVI